MIARKEQKEDIQKKQYIGKVNGPNTIDMTRSDGSNFGQEGILRDVSGTKDNVKSANEQNDARITINGAVRINIRIPVYEGLDNTLAAAILRGEHYTECVDIHLQSDSEGLIKYMEYKVKCVTENDEYCSPEDCLVEDHTTPVEEVRNTLQNIELKYLPTTARTINSRCQMIITHFIRPKTKDFSLWLDFQDNSVFLTGDLWLHEFDPINKSIGRDGCLTEESVKEMEEIVRHLEWFKTTVSLEQEVIRNEYKMSREDAEKVAAIASGHIIKDKSHHAPSNLTFFSAHSLQEEEFESYDSAVFIRGAIQESVRTARNMGKNLTNEEVIKELNISQQMPGVKNVCQVQYNSSDCVEISVKETVLKKMMEALVSLSGSTTDEEVWYHTILDLASSRDETKWTHRRKLQESEIEPFDPWLMNDLPGQVEVKVVVHSRSLVAEGKTPELCFVGEKEYFWEVPLLQFFMIATAGTHLTRMKWISQSPEYVETRNLMDKARKWHKVHDIEDYEVLKRIGRQKIWKNQKGEHFIPWDNWRSRYILRPKKVEKMTLAEFVSWYSVKKRSDFKEQDFENKREDLDRLDGIQHLLEGPFTTLAHDVNMFLPQMMMLSNGTIMEKKRRQGVLQFSTDLDDFACQVCITVMCIIIIKQP